MRLVVFYDWALHMGIVFSDKFLQRFAFHQRLTLADISFLLPVKLRLRKSKRFSTFERRRHTIMTNRNSNSNNINIPEAREAMDKFKMEAASDVGVPKQ